MKNLTLFSLIVLLATIPVLGEENSPNAYPSERDRDTLIFSTSHATDSQSDKKSGVLKIEISAFTPILQVDVNGERINVDVSSSVRFDYPFLLERPINTFLVTVVTEKGKTQKTFSIRYGKKKPPKTKAFSLVGIVKGSGTDNVNTSKSDKKSATKWTITVVPSYNIDLSDNSRIALRGILLRERYSNSDYSSKEVSYTRVATRWIKKGLSVGDLFGELGYNTVKMDSENAADGTDSGSTEMVVAGGLRRNVNATSEWDVKAEYKRVDSNVEATNSDEEADGGEFKLRGQYRMKTGRLRHTGLLECGAYDAKGKYKDYTFYKLGYKTRYSIDRWSSSAGISIRKKNASDTDPWLGKRREDTTSQLVIKMGRQLMERLHVGVEYKMRVLSSTINDAEYNKQILSLSALYMY